MLLALCSPPWYREAEGKVLLPDKVTPHTLRRTFASLALAADRDPRCG